MADDGLLDLCKARIGKSLKDKWTIDALIGVGGMAAVYAATHRNGKKVAVKMLHPAISMNEFIRQRFLREGYVGNSVGHRGVVMVDDDDVSEDGSAFLVMELLQGETLDTRLSTLGGRLAQDEVMLLSEQVLDTLSAAHAKGIVHRDLKPENLFLTKEGIVKVLDFGIARLREGQGQSATQTGSMMGTPAFMAPEQARGRWNEVDARTDLWAIGATMFTLLTGHYVHEAETVNDLLFHAMGSPARSVATVDSGLHPAVVEVVDRALQYARENRYPAAAEMQAAVRGAYEQLLRAGLVGTLGIARRQDSWADVSGTFRPSSELKPAPAVTTSRGVTTTVDASASAAVEPKKKMGLFVGLGAAALAAVGVAVFALGGKGGASEPAVAASPVGAEPVSAVAEPSPPPAQKPAEPVVVAEAPKAAEPEVPPASPAAKVSASAPAPSKPAAAPVRVPGPLPKPAAAKPVAAPKPTLSKPTPTKPSSTKKPAADPFSRRY